MNSLQALLVSLYFACALFAQPLHQIVILGDPHLPGQAMEKKISVLQTINRWKEVDAVVAIGDLCSQTGIREEYETVKSYFSMLEHPLYPITGNHDFIYEDALDENGKLKHASLEIQKQKLERFQQTFGLSKLYYSIEKDPYLLIFLSADTHKYLSGISDEQLSWFNNELKKNPKKPTIVFFHAPLNHTLESYKHWVNTPSFVAQPVETIKSILKKHPQLFLWVSGHTHTSADEPSFASSINLYENHVTNIHNSDMNKKTIWTNTLVLHPDKVIVKTYNHTTQTWENHLERTFIKPTF